MPPKKSLKSLTAILLLLSAFAGVICLAPSDASADRARIEYQPLVIPQCLVYSTKNAKEVCGYATIEEVRALYAADAELAAAREQIRMLNLRVELQGAQIRDLTLAINAVGKATGVWEDRSRELSAQLIALDLKYQKERVKPRWGTWLSWSTAGVAGAVLLGFVGHAVLVE